VAAIGGDLCELWGLVTHILAGDAMNLAARKLRVQSLGIALSALVERRCHPDLDEARGPSADPVAIRFAICGRWDEHHQPLLRQLERQPAQCEIEVVTLCIGVAGFGVQKTPHSVTVEHAAGNAFLRQASPHSSSQAGLSGGRQPREPNNRSTHARQLLRLCHSTTHHSSCRKDWTQLLRARQSRSASFTKSLSVRIPTSFLPSTTTRQPIFCSNISLAASVSGASGPTVTTSVFMASLRTNSSIARSLAWVP